MLIHKFELGDVNYVYDTRTEHILQVDDLTFALLDDIGVLPTDEIMTKYSESFSREEVNNALRDIEKAHSEQAVFSSEGYDSVSDIDIYKDRAVHPRLITLNITNRCNLRCHYCRYTYDHRRNVSAIQQDMTIDVAKKAVDFFFENTTAPNPLISLTGGEPLLLFPLIKHTVEYIDSMNVKNPPKYYVSTNLTLLTEEMTDFFVTRDFDIQVSLDGPQTIHDRHRVLPNEDGTHHKVMRNLMMIREYDQDYIRNNVKCHCVVTPPYGESEYLPFFLAFERFAGYKFTHVSGTGTDFFQTYCDPLDLEVVPGEDVLLDNLGEYLERGAQSGPDDDIYDIIVNKYGQSLSAIHTRKRGADDTRNMHHAGQCPIGSLRLCVDILGNFYPCEKLSDANRYIIGHVDTGIQNSRILDLCELLDELRSSMCKDCWAIKRCSFCVGNLHSKETKPEALDAVCAGIKQQIDTSLKLYCLLLERSPELLKEICVLSHELVGKYPISD